jgi:hypothetical protein
MLPAEGKASPSFWEENDLPRHQDLALRPNLPNRFLGVCGAWRFYEDALGAKP